MRKLFLNNSLYVIVSVLICNETIKQKPNKKKLEKRDIKKMLDETN